MSCSKIYSIHKISESFNLKASLSETDIKIYDCHSESVYFTRFSQELYSHQLLEQHSLPLVTEIHSQMKMKPGGVVVYMNVSLGKMIANQ